MFRTLLAVSFLFCLSSSLSGAIYKGQNLFITKCRTCHTNGQDFIKKYDVKEWDSYMQDDAKKLVDIHLKSKKAKKSWKYFKSHEFRKKTKHLRQFLHEYAKGTGNIPACN